MIVISKSFVWLACLLAVSGESFGNDSNMRLNRGENSDAMRRKRSDDPNLQAVVEQQAAALQQLQADVSAMRSEQTAIKQALPSTFSPVAFCVRFSHDDSTHGLALSPHATLQFDSVITNVGGDYDIHTGIFTAPHAGVYSFYISFMSVIGKGHTYVSLVKEGDLMDYAFANGGDDYDQGSTEVVVQLTAGQQVWTRMETGSAVRGDRFTIFSGHLVQAD